MIRPGCPVVVEGRYDKIRLSRLIDGIILETGGFSIRKNRELVKALKSIARDRGLIILTDSDAAGFQIRRFLTDVLGSDAKLTHVYIPAVAGQKRRGGRSAGEGLLGVEGMELEVLERAFKIAGIGCTQAPNDAGITRADLLDAQILGVPGAAARRRELAAMLGLPPRISSHVLLRFLNGMLTRDEFWQKIKAMPPRVPA